MLEVAIEFPKERKSMAQPERNMAETTAVAESIPVGSQTGPEARADIGDVFKRVGEVSLGQEVKKEPVIAPTEAGTVPTANSAKPEQARQFTREEVIANAALPDEERLQVVEKLLGPLTEEQAKALKRMHEVGKDRPGAGVYNYNQEEIREKVRIGREKTETRKPVFSSEERRKLFQAGLVGVLPPAAFMTFNRTPYAGTPLEAVAEEIYDVGTTGGADEGFLKRNTERIQGLVDSRTVTFAQARDLLRALNVWRITAEQPPAVATAPARPPSVFGQMLSNLEVAKGRLQTEQENLTAAQAMPATTAQQVADRLTAINAAQAAITREQVAASTELQNRTDLFRDLENLTVNGKELELLSRVRDPLMAIFYGSRVEVGQKEKLGMGEYEGRGTLERLSILQQFLKDPSIIDRDRSAKVAQIVQGSGIFQGESPEFWASLRELENLPEIVAFKQKFHMNSLEEGLRGVFDYFNREGLDMVVEVVKNRKRYTSEDPLNPVYPDNALINMWHTKIKDKNGRVLKNEVGEEITAENFNDVREAIEEARRREPWIANRGDYETWIQFVADDPEELEEMIPYIVDKVTRKLGTGEPNSVFQTLTQEWEKMDKALAAFPTENERQFRRLKSIMAGKFKLKGAYFFSNLTRKDWQPYQHFLDFLANSFQDTEYQDHFVDSVLLDREGLVMLADAEFFANDGEFWRYGQKRADLATRGDDTGALLGWQQQRRKQIEEKLMGRKLRSMKELLGISGAGVNPPTMHPAFARLKVKLDALDAQDPNRNNQGFVTRWKEYCDKAQAWEDSRGQIFSDPRDHTQRIIFQHPLARVFRPRGYKDGQGNVTAIDELDLMYEPDANQDKWYQSIKRRKVRAAMEALEQSARAFGHDSAAALAWHVFSNATELSEAQKYVNVNTGEAVAHETLLRGMLQACIKEDENKPWEQKRFKLYSILTKKLGLDIDSPLFAAWYLGAHDTFRPALLRYIYQEPGLAQILQINNDRRSRKVKLIDGRDDPTAADEKATIARWAEDERRIILAMELVLKREFPKYFNFPGHDTPGAGVKDLRNPLLPAYGTSTDTVEINALISDMLAGEGKYGKHYGITKNLVRQLVGLTKGPDEVFFMETGGVLENPRDTESWVKRLFGAINEYGLWTKGKEGSTPHGLLNDGVVAGAYHLRAKNRDARNWPGSETEEFATEKPEDAYNKMNEDAYEAYIDTAAKFVGPLMGVMHLRLSELDSTYGRNPGSALFMNTLLWYAVSRWMDENPEEFRVKFGFAYDVDLSLARTFIHTVLYESRLIHNDKQFDEAMVGYTRVERGGQVINVIRYNVDSQGNTITLADITVGKNVLVKKGESIPSNQGEVHEGIIDAFPPDLRKEIIDNKWLPMGIDSYRPETLKVLKEHYDREGNPRTRRIYRKAAELIGVGTKSRTIVSRP